MDINQEVINGPSPYENVILTPLPRLERIFFLLLSAFELRSTGLESEKENPFSPRQRVENTPFLSMKDVNFTSILE